VRFIEQAKTQSLDYCAHDKGVNKQALLASRKSFSGLAWMQADSQASKPSHISRHKQKSSIVWKHFNVIEKNPSKVSIYFNQVLTIILIHRQSVHTATSKLNAM
jgi:hypothetical protein